MFSRRLPAVMASNALSRALEDLRARGVAVADLTESNPTRAGIPYPDDLLAPLATSSLRYDPQPFGLGPARAAVAADHARRGVSVHPDQVVLTASTSEAYSWLFKLLCNPGDTVLVPRPSYPLFEHLTMLDAVGLQPYALDYHGRWEIDLASIDAAPETTRAVLVVSPNNPTGSFLTAAEHGALSERCVRRGWALIVDEVFADYPLDAVSPVTDVAARTRAPGAVSDRSGGSGADCLTFSLGGLSKCVGLPQLKLAWIVAGGPPSVCNEALARLELIADSYLSVATPVQCAAAHLLTKGGAVRAAIAERVRENLAALRAVAAQFPACDVLPVEGGWSAVLRLPATRGEERLVLDLLEEERILVHPGYFFDFPREAYLIASLLTPPDVFAEALPRLLRHVSG